MSDSFVYIDFMVDWSAAETEHGTW